MDGEGYIPSSALELPPPAAATVADAAAVLAAAPARLTRAAAGRNHDNISRRTAVAPAAAIAAASDVGRPGAVDGEGYIPSSALELPPSAAATVADAAAVLATAPARLTRAAAGRNHDNISRRTAVAPAAAVAAASDVGRPGAVDGEGYIPSSALELPPPAAATVADAAAVLATAPARLTRAAAGRNHDNISRRTAVAQAAAVAAASDVGRPGAVDGEGYIPSSALELPPPAAATVADAAAVLATAPARLTRAAAGRNHDNISRRTAVAQAAAVAAASDVGRPGAVDGEGYIPSSALELPPPAAATVADAAAVLATAPARLTRAAAGRNHDNISRRTAVAPAAAVAAASDVGRPGAVDGEGYIPSSALELPPFAAAQWPTQQPCSRRRRRA